MRAAVSPAAATAALAQERVWELIEDGERAVVVDSPPGGGKSTLVREVARRLADTGEQVPLVVQNSDQADDLAYALGWQLAAIGAKVGRLQTGDRAPRPQPPPNLVCSGRVHDLDGCVAVVATAAKWSHVVERSWSIGIVDEAHQMSSSALARVAGMFDGLLLVGDPGQLEPFAATDEPVVRPMAGWRLDTAAGTVLRNHPRAPVVALPVSWRLPPPAAEVVSAAFYARRFGSGSLDRARRLRFEVSPMPDAAGRVLTVAAGSGWGVLELPEAYLPRTDPQAVAAIAEVVGRLVGAGAVVADEAGSRPLRAQDVAVGVNHSDQRSHVRAALSSAGLEAVTVETANRLQGREFEVTVVWHPLSGRRDASAFHLEAGRLCVLASRHRQACVVVTRGGVRELLDTCPPTEPVWLGTGPPRVDGWQAHHLFLEQLRPNVVRW